MLFILFVLLREVLPLPTEVRGGRRLLLLYDAESTKARHTAHDWKMTRAADAIKLALDNLRVFSFHYREQAYPTTARRARKILQKLLFHIFNTTTFKLYRSAARFPCARAVASAFAASSFERRMINDFAEARHGEPGEDEQQSLHRQPVAYFHVQRRADE